MKKIYPTEKYKKYDDIRDLVEEAAMKNHDKALFRYFAPDGKTVCEMSYCEFAGVVRGFGTELASIGFGDKRTAILSESRPEWIAAYIGIIGGGGVTVPLDRELQPDRLADFLELSETEVLVYSGEYEKVVSEIAPRLVNIKHFIAMDRPENVPEHLADRISVWEDFVNAGKEKFENGDKSYTEVQTDKDVMCAVIFTSGTTGTSKGVMLTQNNILSCIYASANMVNFSSKDTILSVLPLHHTYETCCGMLTPICIGLTVCINNSLKYVVRNMNKFRPTGMVLVPLFVTTIYKKICDEVKKKGKEKILDKGIAVTKAARKVGIDLRKPVFSEIRKNLGGRLCKMISGGAALDPDLVDRFDEIGIQIAQGYGITECAPLVSVNPYTNLKYGSVGVPIKGSEVKILNTDPETGETTEMPTGEIGEICVKGPHVMIGYYNDPEATAAAFTEDGFFKTGDLGYVDEENYIFITGRIKNLIILSNGKNIYPEEIEEYLNKIDLICECVVLAREVNGENMLTAVVYPEYSMLEGLTPEEIKEKIKSEITAVNKKLPVFKQIRNIEIKKSEFEKTTSKKIIRYKV